MAAIGHLDASDINNVNFFGFAAPLSTTDTTRQHQCKTSLASPTVQEIEQFPERAQRSTGIH